ncbi:RDD family protein [Demequina pelophila]|uniref:RDD family protein n=1 Tax=Demequina pelophila TaxID=1638984 RepID=UPI000782F7E3|nr:RDD family protein [Demequina pelophila]
MTDEDDILIGEGVVLDSSAAPVTLRVLSGAIDMLALLAVFVVGVWAFGDLANALTDAWARAIGTAWLVLALVVAPATLETFTRGRSLGRLAVGLRIVRDDGGPVGARHAFLRAMAGVLEIFATFGMLAATVSTLGARGKRIGDHLAGTYAMRVRGARRTLPPVAMPPELASWARTVDVTRLPDGLALTARMFLARAPHMHAPSRARVGTSLDARLRTHVSPAPPEGTHPEAFIAAVLAERGSRETRLETARVERAYRESARLRALPYGVPDAEN